MLDGVFPIVRRPISPTAN